MDTQKLIGMRVRNTDTHIVGIIEYINEGIIAVNYYGEIKKYSYPSVFSGILELEDEEIQDKIFDESTAASFDNFKKNY